MPKVSFLGFESLRELCAHYDIDQCVFARQRKNKPSVADAIIYMVMAKWDPELYADKRSPYRYRKRFMDCRSMAEFCRERKISYQLLKYYLKTMSALEAIKMCEKCRDGEDRRGNEKGTKMLSTRERLDVKYAEETRDIRASKVKPGFYVWDAPYVEKGEPNYEYGWHFKKS